jgi:acetolactate synthase-1/2/3 large subunit
VNQLYSEGIDTVFSLPGVQIMSVFDSLYEFRDRIRLIQTRHEQATTYMADGYAKASGKPAAAIVVPGPGLLNATAGLGTAYSSSSPVLLISGQIQSDSIGKQKGELHEIHNAMHELKTGRPRPVELEIPYDFLTDTVETNLMAPSEYPRKEGSQNNIQKAVQLLSSSENPTIIAGGGTTISGASSELLELAELLQAPILTTNQAKGIIPSDHYLNMGTEFAGLGPGERIIPYSDVVIGIGTRFMTDFTINKEQRIIQVNIDPDELGRNTRCDIGILGDAKTIVRQILNNLQSRVKQRRSRKDSMIQQKKEYRKELKEIAPAQMEIVEILQNTLPGNSILVGGITNAAYWNHLAYEVRNPRSYLTSSYFGTLGYAFPTALGAKIAQPEKPVVSISGDGGFMFSAQELSTAVKYKINIVALVFNNNAYGASRRDQTDNYEERYIGTDLFNPDFKAMAESFGAIGLRSDIKGLPKTLDIALNANAPVLLEVQVPIMPVPSPSLRTENH